MRWTREPLYKTSGWFNQEPLTTFDETLRFPIALEEIYRLIRSDYGISIRKEEIKIQNGYIYFRPFSDYILQIIFQPQFYTRLPKLIFQTNYAKENFNQLVKEFLEELDGVCKTDPESLTTEKLYDHLLKVICFDALWVFKLADGLHTVLHYFSESVLKSLYALLIKDPNPSNYSNLLIGFPNKLFEADKAFWQVVQDKLSREEYLSRYGYRATDATLFKEVVGEDLEEKIEIFKKIAAPNFDKLTRVATERRKKRESFIDKNFRNWVPFGRSFFNKALALAREYITVREDRRFYYTMGTYPIRRACLELGSRVDFLNEPSDIFFMTKNEVGAAVRDSKAINKEEIRERITSRKTNWQIWRKKTPPTVIEG